MSSTVTIPQVPHGLQYVGASLLSTVFVLVGQNFTVSKWRKRAGIKYPQMYAEKAEVAASRDALIFNCAQRAHQNTLENIPIVYVTTVLTGLKYPILAATACGIWSVSRIAYTRGYLTGDPAKRANVVYIFGSISMLGLLLTSVYTVGQSICSSL
ncbi:putative MAPEG family protein [Lyophyllum shimeji]|uniref:MAPEG family protein n=1 Tax=Lyophyllum shimeji TaxID=47721 RepID=A0A9P3UM35_LYOSH|nr:putative MAPEG family protein [Lyophyllum shimeji]